MANVNKELIDIFEQLSTESQQTLLMYARVAGMAENSVRKAIDRALQGEGDIKSS